MNNLHCCNKMYEHIYYKCSTHPNIFDCPDNLIYYNEIFDEYGIIIHDGGQSYNSIKYCPWCGKELPISKRNLWFKVLNKLGYDNPIQDDIPAKYKTNRWWLE